MVLAKEVLADRTITEKGNNAMTIGTRIRNAFQSLASRVHNRASTTDVFEIVIEPLDLYS